jgi:hypothetical protein
MNGDWTVTHHLSSAAVRHRPFSAQDFSFSPTARAPRKNSSSVVPVPRSDSARRPQVKVSIEKTSFLVGSTPN